MQLCSQLWFTVLLSPLIFRNSLPRCIFSKVAQVEQVCVGHEGRVNAVTWVRGHGAETEFVSVSADRTARVWRELPESKRFETIACLIGHTDVVTVADAVTIGQTAVTSQPEASDSQSRDTRTLVVTASVDSTVRVWQRSGDSDDFPCTQTLSFGTGFALSVALALIHTPHGQVPIVACGGDDCKIHIYLEQDGQFVRVQTLLGHEDWVTSVQFTSDDNGDLLLASASQDTYIRLYRLAARDPEVVRHLTSQRNDLDLEEDIRMKETTFFFTSNGVECCYAVTLETVLQGHENWVYSVQWQPKQVKDGRPRQPMCLLSASMDKTMILWCLDTDTGSWADQVRVGEVGGNSLGFYGGLFGPEGDSIMAHGYQGAFQRWTRNQLSGDWEAEATCGGHFDAVQDVAWQRGPAHFLLSVSVDQTTRCHGYWRAGDSKKSGWYEIARPQIHGYDLTCLAALGPYSFASGADEKVTRIFTAPRNFVTNFAALTKQNVSADLESLTLPEGASVPALGFSNKASVRGPYSRMRPVSIKQDTATLPEGASVPALGLSNKAVFERELKTGQSSEEGGEAQHPASQYPEVYFVPQTMSQPPDENTLLQNTLWPEVQKLYGHGYEVYAVAAHPNSHTLATACKAAKPEHAGILLWDCHSWRKLGSLPAHSLTVTQLAFSHDGTHLLSVSRDRTWTLFRETAGEDVPYKRVAGTDKKTSVHSRIIWACAWSHDDAIFVTVSRDKKALLWNPGSCAEIQGPAYSCCSAPLDLQDSVTAVDFAPCVVGGGLYLLAFGLENGRILLYTWNSSEGMSKEAWSKRAELEQRDAHHLTVKRLQFRPVVGTVETDTEKKMANETSRDFLQLASCGEDHIVRIYTIDLKKLLS